MQSLTKLARCVVVSLVAIVPADVVDAATPCAPLATTIGQSVPATAAPGSPKPAVVASLNLAGEARILGEVVAWTHQRHIDVLLLQEVGPPSSDGAAFVAALSEQLGFQSAYAPADIIGGAGSQGLAIVSRYPLDDIRVYPLEHHHLRFRSRCRIALTARVMTETGPIQVVNVHLDTRINSNDRLAQLAPVLEDLVGVRVPQIVGGDFNTMNVGWLQTMWPFPGFQRQSKAVQTLLGAGGFHTPFVDGPATLTFLGVPFKLDWLYLKQLKAIDCSVDDVRYSDHRGIWARVAPEGGSIAASRQGSRPSCQ